MEEIKVTGGNLKAKLKEILHEGNVRRIVIRNPQGRTLLDLPLTAGVDGAAVISASGSPGTFGFILAAIREMPAPIEVTPTHRRGACLRHQSSGSRAAAPCRG